MKKDNFVQFIKEFVKSAYAKIKELATKELENTTKKQQLDAAIIAFIEKAMTTMKLSIFTKFVINKFVIPYVDEFTQVIYDLIKVRLKGVTL